jgi:hypothetical protein
MAFDESKHPRGGEGTQQGGQFVSKGAQGTPSETNPKREAKIAELHAYEKKWNPTMCDTPEKEAKHIAYLNAAMDEKELRREHKKATEKSHLLLEQAAKESDAERKDILINAAKNAVAEVNMIGTVFEEKLNELSALRDEFFAAAKQAGPPTEAAPPTDRDKRMAENAMRPNVDPSLLSPNGRMSKRARNAANERTRQELFGPAGLQKAQPKQESHKAYLLRWAKELRGLAERGMKPRAYKKKAEEYEAEAAGLPDDEGSAGQANTAESNRGVLTK